jgi:hypothetical protein
MKAEFVFLLSAISIVTIVASQAHLAHHFYRLPVPSAVSRPACQPTALPASPPPCLPAHRPACLPTALPASPPPCLPKQSSHKGVVCLALLNANRSWPACSRHKARLCGYVPCDP